ncbi:hypothetical protein [Clostridium grantii]|uniref:Uncharacterized protein n=1 Tax=Clostridium grantii DSM 8605 TaxID=1121316 RepID=A0A1M5T1K9_9CLOT|nr:hypothetical protein [Clostridium grantii]SHH44233.1 hypothetical protein SAMN02745207_01136 [Clostridium grantii DSM 8605]
MSISFKDYIKVINEIDVKKLQQLKETIEKTTEYQCKGEVNILNSNNEVLVQTHYEYFDIYFADPFIIMNRYNPKTGMATLDYVHISIDKISDYKIEDNSLTLKGKLDENTNIKVVIVFKEKKIKNIVSK